MEISIGLCMLLLFGFIGGQMARFLKFPAVTGYMIAGIVMGPSVFNLIPENLNQGMDFVKLLGIGLIALIIGGDLHIKGLRTLGKSIFIITAVQVGGAFAAVFLVTRYLLGISTPMSLLLGAMASATAPASPVAVIHEYRAKGPLTSSILAVVGLDDAFCVTLFVIVSSLAAAMTGEGSGLVSGPLPMIATRIAGSAAAGAVVGFILTIILMFIGDRHQRLVLMIGVALLSTAVAGKIGLEGILVAMMVGFIAANFGPDPHLFDIMEDIELPVFVVFFALAGASLRFDMLYANWAVAVVYVLARGIGKVGGVFAGAAASGADSKVRRYLGFAMFSKAGVTIGLLMIVQSRFPAMAPRITAIELAAVAVCELIGPVGTRYALLASGEGKT